MTQPDTQNGVEQWMRTAALEIDGDIADYETVLKVIAKHAPADDGREAVEKLRRIRDDMNAKIAGCCGSQADKQFCESYGCGTLQKYVEQIDSGEPIPSLNSRTAPRGGAEASANPSVPASPPADDRSGEQPTAAFLNAARAEAVSKWTEPSDRYARDAIVCMKSALTWDHDGECRSFKGGACDCWQQWMHKGIRCLTRDDKPHAISAVALPTKGSSVLPPHAEADAYTDDAIRRADFIAGWYAGVRSTKE